MSVIGIISDTHSLVRPEAIEALQGCDRIVHAGDIGSIEVIERLSAIAPISAIRGNIDKGEWGFAAAKRALLSSVMCSGKLGDDFGDISFNPIFGNLKLGERNWKCKPARTSTARIDVKYSILLINAGFVRVP